MGPVCRRRKGAASRKSPAQITGACEHLGRDPEALVHASRTAAKVDSAAVQDGYQLYHHARTSLNRAALAERKKDDSQGVMGMFRGLKARYTVTFDERRDTARFPLIFQQHLTTASANDTREYASGPRRCHEGPIPVQCRTASCGTCWVGVLGGAEKLSEVDEMEARRMKEFGYINTTEATPVIRLACMALGSGNVSIVIPGTASSAKPASGHSGHNAGLKEETQSILFFKTFLCVFARAGARRLRFPPASGRR